MVICAATGNAKKLAELRRILELAGHTVVSQKELNITLEPEETGTTFEENAHIKAAAICKESGMPTLADDSGLEVDALGGAPGVYSARYCGRHGDDAANNQKLLKNLGDVPPSQRTGRFVSAVCLCMPDGRSLTLRGECPGFIADKLTGEGGFGYDPLFIPTQLPDQQGNLHPNTQQITFSQLEDWQKDAISHRGKVLERLQQELPQFLQQE